MHLATLPGARLLHMTSHKQPILPLSKFPPGIVTFSDRSTDGQLLRRQPMKNHGRARLT